MEEMQKITLEVPKHLLKSLKDSTKKGTSEIIREALREKAAREAQHAFAALRGTLKTKLTYEEMRGWEDE